MNIQSSKQYLGINASKKPATDFSTFFHNASSADKKKLFSGVVREANKDQRDLVEKYNISKQPCRQ
jgi:hypothetical protein